jgi:hypothetical protein
MKAEILNKYFSSISNSNDENKVLPDFDCRCFPTQVQYYHKVQLTDG